LTDVSVSPSIATHPDRVSVALSGDIDYAAVPKITAATLTALDLAEGRPIEVDLTEVTFMDSSGIGAMLEAQRQCANRGTAFAIIAIPDRIRRLFALTGVDGVLRVAELR
jgi:anti-sigma B factor antagonist